MEISRLVRHAFVLFLALHVTSVQLGERESYRSGASGNEKTLGIVHIYKNKSISVRLIIDHGALS